MISFTQLCRYVGYLCAKIAHPVKVSVRIKFVWYLAVYFLLLLGILFLILSGYFGVDVLVLCMYAPYTFLLILASDFLIASGLDGDSLPSPYATVYSGHCPGCTQILTKSKLMRGWGKRYESQSELHTFHTSPDASDNNDRPIASADAETYTSCLLCKTLICSLQAARHNFPPLESGRGQMEARLSAELPNYGTLSGPWPASNNKPTLQIFWEAGTCLQLHMNGSSSSVFRVFSSKGDRGSQAEAYQVPPILTCNTGSSEVASLARKWIRTCCDSHSECRSSHPYRPKRLLHIISASQVQIVLTDPTPEIEYEYTALSHRWGNGVPLRLTTASKAKLTQPFHLAELSVNFQDAVRFTESLGYFYIWIDSLCIIQDSPEDWAAQSVLMSAIYASAMCTLAAAASPGPQAGCFRDRIPAPPPECILMGSQYSYAFIRPGDSVGIDELFQRTAETAPLSQRGWTFQERLLSLRVIHFCEDIVLFECNSMRASELHSVDGIPYKRKSYVRHDGRLLEGHELEKLKNPQPEFIRVQKRKPYLVPGKARVRGIDGGAPLVRNPAWIQQQQLISQSARYGIRGALDMLQSLPHNLSLDEKFECHRHWFELVTTYSSRGLSFRSDRLVALAGLANLISSKTGMLCVSGLWDATLALDLLWTPKLANQTRPKLSIAPSWSWASVDGQVESLLLDFNSGRSVSTGQLDLRDKEQIRTEARINPSNREDPNSLTTAKSVELIVEGPMKIFAPGQIPAKFDFKDTPPDIELICLLIYFDRRWAANPGRRWAGLLLNRNCSYADNENVYERVGSVRVGSTTPWSEIDWDATPWSEDGWETKRILLV